ncbi:MAG: pilin [bacterium]
MINKSVGRKLVITSVIFIVFFLAQSEVFAQGLKDARFHSADSAGYGGYEEWDINVLLGGVVNGSLALVGTIFLIILIYGGYLWMTASDNEQQIEKARNSIKAAIVGLFIVVGAYAISYFAVEKFFPKSEPAQSEIIDPWAE